MIKTKKIISIIISALAIIIFAFWNISSHFFSFSSGNQIKTVTVANQRFQAETVSNADKMQKGLGERDELCQTCAMLFEFTEKGKHSFWMNGMRFSLDILWIADDKVVHIEKNVSEKFLGFMIPSSDANRVLEINAGIVDKIGIKIGDMVSF